MRMATFVVVSNLYSNYNVYMVWECYCTEQSLI
jgi:hypothetical protein